MYEGSLPGSKSHQFSEEERRLTINLMMASDKLFTMFGLEQDAPSDLVIHEKIYHFFYFLRFRNSSWMNSCSEK